MNKEQLTKDLLDHTILTVKYHLTDKNRVIQRILIDIRDFTDDIDIFNLLQYLNDRLQSMYKKQVSSSKDQKDFLRTKKDQSIYITQFANSNPAYRSIPYVYTTWSDCYLLVSLMDDLHGIEDVIESYIGFYLSDINY